MGPIRCPETSVNNYHMTPCNNPEDHRSHILNVYTCFLTRLDTPPFPGSCLCQQPQAVFQAEGALPFVRRLLQVSHLVLQVPTHGEPVQCLVSTTAYTGVVHIGRDHHANAVFAPSETGKTKSYQYTLCATKICRLKLPVSDTGSDTVGVIMSIICNFLVIPATSYFYTFH
jgi:hypothetical protein